MPQTTHTSTHTEPAPAELRAELLREIRTMSDDRVTDLWALMKALVANQGITTPIENLIEKIALHYRCGGSIGQHDRRKGV